jgi:hypothetical protein
VIGLVVAIGVLALALASLLSVAYRAGKARGARDAVCTGPTGSWESLGPHLDTGSRGDFKLAVAQTGDLALRPRVYAFAHDAEMIFLMGVTANMESWKGHACATLAHILRAHEKRNYRKALEKAMELLFLLEAHLGKGEVQGALVTIAHLLPRGGAQNVKEG